MYIWQRRVSCMSQAILTLSGAHTTSSHFGYFTSVDFIIRDVFLTNAGGFLIS